VLQGGGGEGKWGGEEVGEEGVCVVGEGLKRKRVCFEQDTGVCN